MKPCTAELKGLYGIEKVSLHEISKCVHHYIEKFDFPVNISMNHANAKEFAKICSGTFVEIPTNYTHKPVIRLAIKQSKDMSSNVIFII